MVTNFIEAVELTILLFKKKILKVSKKFEKIELS